MKYENIIDMHTHSVNSFDGNHTCTELCESALKKGAIGIAITDHLDVDDKSLEVASYAEEQFLDTLEAKNSFKGKMAVLQGIEFGQGIFRQETSEMILGKYPYDFVLGSIHNLENMQDFYFLDYKKENVDDLLRRYFEAEYQLACWNWFDSLAHLTYPLRYIEGNYGIAVDLAPYQEMIDAILEKLVYNKKALELNMSSIDCYHKDTMPSKALIKRFRELGGKYVTVGSDSHYKEKVCFGIEQGYDILQECGFSHFTVFVQHEPWLMPLR